MREARALFHLVHVNPGVDGCRYLKMSTTQHASKRPRRAEGQVLSRDQRVRATSIQSPVENRIKVAAQQRGNRKVNFRLKIVQKMVPGRITIGDIQTANAKGLVPERKLTLEVTPLRFTPGAR